MTARVAGSPDIRAARQRLGAVVRDVLYLTNKV